MVRKCVNWSGFVGSGFFSITSNDGDISVRQAVREGIEVNKEGYVKI